MTAPYRPTNPFARRYRRGNPFARHGVAEPELETPEPARPDATSVDVLRPEREQREAIARNLREGREEALDVAPLTEREIGAAQRRNISPLTGGVAQGFRTLGGGVAQRGAELAAALTGSEALRQNARRVRRLRERAETADIAATEGEGMAPQVVRSLVRTAVETAPAIPLLGGAGFTGPLAERVALRAAQDAAAFGTIEGGLEALSTRPSVEQAAERMQSGFRAGALFGGAAGAVPRLRRPGVREPRPSPTETAPVARNVERVRQRAAVAEREPTPPPSAAREIEPPGERPFPLEEAQPAERIVVDEWAEAERRATKRARPRRTEPLTDVELKRKYQRDSDDALRTRWRDLVARMNRESSALGDEIQPWTRWDDDIGEMRSGTAITHRGGRAIAAVNRDGRLSDEVARELARRGERSADEVLDELIGDYMQSGRIHPAVMRGLAGAGVGGVIGGTEGETAGDRLRNAALGAVAGGALAAGLAGDRRGFAIVGRRRGALQREAADIGEVRAAIRLRDGRVFTGGTHPDAAQEAERALGAGVRVKPGKDYESGFVDATGRWYTRDEAAALLTPDIPAYRRGESAEIVEASRQGRPKRIEARDALAELYGQERGAATVAAVRALARTGLGGVTGATIGARADEESPTRGALVGGLAGAAALGPGPAGVRRGLEAFRRSRVGQDLARTLAPHLRSPEAAEAARTLRASLGRRAQDIEQAVEAFHPFRGAVEHLSVPQRYAFIDAIERGARQPTPELDAVAGVARRLLDGERDAIRALGTGKLDQFIDNYFPHIWADPAEAQRVLSQMAHARRPFQGGASFLRRRTIPTVADGVAAGLEPATTNPIDLVLLKHAEMRRYRMAHETFRELRQRGLVKFVRPRAQIPEGYTRINDPIATVFGPMTQEGARTIRGEYWAPEPVANVLNNHLAPGLRGKPVYDAYMGIGNTLNQAQLGLSAFHLGFTSLDAATSRAALAIRMLRGGNLGRGLATALTVPVAPLSNIVRGDKTLRAYLGGTTDPTMARIVKAITESGGRVRMDALYRTNATRALREAMRTGKGLRQMAVRAGLVGAGGALVDEEHPARGFMLGAALGVFGPGFLEQAARPIMEYVVPRQKLGVFFDLARYELEKLPAAASPDEVRRILQGAWDSVDNRLGQLVYDNLFWNRTFKDLAMASVRAVGWNLGTIRELGGGAIDLARGRLTSKADYVLALPLTVGLFGAITTYLYTGRGPEGLKDYFFPPTGEQNRDGNVERVQLPSYIKDIIAYGRHPVRTVGHKVHPEIGTLLDMLQNEDFYGDRIRNEHAPLVQQARQMVEYIGTQFVPFGIRNVQELRQRTGRGLGGAPSFIGVTPAPRDVTRTPAQNRMSEYLASRRIEGASPEERAGRRARQELLHRLETRRAGQADLSRAVTRHQLTAQQARTLWRQAHGNPLVGRFKRLTLEEAETVFQMGTPSEQRLWRPILEAKRHQERRSYRSTNPFRAAGNAP